MLLLLSPCCGCLDTVIHIEADSFMLQWWDRSIHPAATSIGSLWIETLQGNVMINAVIFNITNIESFKRDSFIATGIKRIWTGSLMPI